MEELPRYNVRECLKARAAWAAWQDRCWMLTWPSLLIFALFLPAAIGTAQGSSGFLGQGGLFLSGACVLALPLGILACVSTSPSRWRLAVGVLFLSAAALAAPLLSTLPKAWRLEREVAATFPTEPRELRRSRAAAFSVGAWMLGPLAEFGTCTLRPPQTAAFKTLENESLLMDIYTPGLADATGAAIYFVHGGWWWSGSRTWYHACFLEYFLQRGFLVASVDYRLTSSGHVAAELVADVADGLHYLVAHANELGINKSSIFAVGESAGGHLAVLSSLLLPGLVRGVVDLWGIQDLLRGRASSISKNWPEAYDLLCGGSPDTAPGCFSNMSTTAHVTAQSPPMLLLHGEADSVVAPEHATLLAARLSEFQVPHVLALAPGQQHGCWGVQQGPCIQWLLFAAERFFTWALRDDK